MQKKSTKVEKKIKKIIFLCNAGISGWIKTRQNHPTMSENFMMAMATERQVEAVHNHDNNSNNSNINNNEKESKLKIVAS